MVKKNKRDSEIKSFFSRTDKKGLSGIIETLIMIGLVLAATVIIWGVVSNILSKNIKNTEACFGNYDKVTLNKKYTCFDDANDKVRVAINIGDVDVDEVLVSVSNEGSSEPFKLSNAEKIVSGVTYFSDLTPEVKLPPKNGGKSYNYTWGESTIGSVKIAPIIQGTQCEISDTISNLESCSLVA